MSSALRSSRYSSSRLKRRLSTRYDTRPSRWSSSPTCAKISSNVICLYSLRDTAFREISVNHTFEAVDELPTDKILSAGQGLALKVHHPPRACDNVHARTHRTS